MKILIGFVLTICSGLPGLSQITIQPTLPAVGLIQKSQLWNLIIVNGRTALQDCRIELVLRDRREGFEVLTASTASVSLPAGSKQLNLNLLSPVQYNYGIGASDRSVNDLLPIGNYIACYSVIIGPEGGRPIAEECIQFDVESLSPPMLLSPRDSSVLEAWPSLFSWMAPTPTALFSSPNYDFILAEVMDGQKAEEAVQENVPILTSSSLPSNVFASGQALSGLKPDKWYAWNIVAKDNKNYAGKSETWVFKTKTETPTERIIRATPYVKMRIEYPEMAVAPNGVIKLSYQNRLSDSTANIVITDLDEEKPVNRVSIPIKLSSGENLIQYPLRKLLSLHKDKTYSAVIINSMGERWILLFRIKEFKD